MQWQSPQERRSRGQAHRKQARRQQHDQLNLKARPASAAELLAEAMRGRMTDLLLLKAQLMAASPFAYFRGAVPVMAADLAQLPSTGLLTQICGDAHVRNLGAFAAADGRLVFDLNDFDETTEAPFEWDLKRMAASIVVAGRESGHSDDSATQAAYHAITRYVSQMEELAHMPLTEASRFQVHRVDRVTPIQDALRKAERATPQHTLQQLTEQAGKRSRRFKTAKPTLWRVGGRERDLVLGSLQPYLESIEPQRRHLLSLYTPIDVAFKVVGTGSVGLRDYCVLFEGNGMADPLFLQIKEEAASAWTPWLGGKTAIPRGAINKQHQGQRVAQGQRAMQVASDPFLGWTRMEERDYLVRQLADQKGSIELEDLAGSGFAAYAEVCGELLARGHSRSADPMVLTGYLGSGEGFADAISRFALAYADQTEKDWNDMKLDLKSPKRTRKGSSKP